MTSWPRSRCVARNCRGQVRSLHEDIYRRTLAGDLTPFKAFRCREYQETVSRMGHLPEDSAVGAAARRRDLHDREVLEACEWLKARGCLMLALSDKPDEATAPSPSPPPAATNPCISLKHMLWGKGLE